MKTFYALLFVLFMVGYARAESSRCPQPPYLRVDFNTPRVVVADWSRPMRLAAPINTACPEDAVEISRDGKYLYFLFTKGILERMTPEEILDKENGTYKAARLGGPGEFSLPKFYDLRKGVNQSLDGELSFSPDGKIVYFHSLRAENTGYQNDPPSDDFQDIYIAEIINAEPGPGKNPGAPVNSIYPDGEHAIYPNGKTLYFTSSRPGGLGNNDIWVSSRSDSSWSEPINLGEPVNSAANDLQPTFTSDGTIMYFTSDRDPSVGMAIYRSSQTKNGWSEPELVIKGLVGEPSITADGKFLYFVHVLADNNGHFDADIWYCRRIHRQVK